MSSELYDALIVLLETIIDLLKRLRGVLWPENE